MKLQLNLSAASSTNTLSACFVDATTHVGVEPTWLFTESMDNPIRTEHFFVSRMLWAD
jgi:hypothetical protein